MPRIKKQHLKRRKDGRYCCVYHGIQFMGVTEEEALQKREEYKRGEQREGVIRENPTVSQYAESWLKRAKPDVSDQTYAESSCLLEKLTKRLGGLLLKEVRASDIKSVYSKDFAGLSDSYIRSGAQLYRAMFDAAVDDGICEKNPARAESAKPHRGTVGSHRAITDMERWWIENLCTDHRAHAAIVAMLYAGIRPQEAKALSIDRDVDFDKGLIYVRESVHLSGTNQYERTRTLKTEYSKRTIPLFFPLRTALDGRKSGMLIASASGELVTVQAWRSVWASYVSAMEVAINGCQERWYGKKREHQGKELPPYIHFTVKPYDLRHSFCTWCRDNGVEINTCVHWMGHADAKMILRVYDEFTPERGKIEAEKLEKLVFHMQDNMQEQK